MHKIINSHVEASKIGRQIADQVMDYQRRLGDSSSGVFGTKSSLSIRLEQIYVFSLQKTALNRQKNNRHALAYNRQVRIVRLA